MNVLLKGVVGSTAYGLAHEGSDVDYMGIFAESNEVILGLNKPSESVVTKDPDTTMHEARKFVALCLNGNPSVSELLWLDTYEHINEMGADLVNLRRSFLAAKQVRDSYLGYAQSQFGRLVRRGDGTFSSDTRKRTAKHARHMVRLVEQGFWLYTTGELIVDLRGKNSNIDPDFVRRMSEQIVASPERAEQYMKRAEVRFEEARSPLPARPDVAAVEKWLIRVRRVGWGLS